MSVSRRRVLTAGALSGAASAIAVASAAVASPVDYVPQGVGNVSNPRGLVDPGPQNPTIANEFPAAFTPPTTDIGDLPQMWASFNNAPRRIQNGGWARQVTRADFAISESISGVNMRLAAGAIREMHWHLAAEWAFLSYGSARITVLDPKGRAFVGDVNEGDLWYFPSGYPHSLQGLGPDGAEFILCFDDGSATEFNTLLLTDWTAHTPPAILAQSLGLPEAALKDIPKHDLYIFQSDVPGPLAADRDAVRSAAGDPPHPFVFALSQMQPTKQTQGGSVKIVDSSIFKASKTVAAAMVTVKPGGLREMHWHPNADEWQYYVKGSAQMTVFNAGPKAVTTNFKAGDVGYVKRSLGHYIKNIGDSDLVFLEVFASDAYMDISLADWLSHTPPAIVAAHLGLSAADIAKLPKQANAVVPA